MLNITSFTNFNLSIFQYMHNFSLIKHLFLTNKFFLINTFFNISNNSFIFCKSIVRFNLSFKKRLNENFLSKKNFYFYFQNFNIFKFFYKKSKRFKFAKLKKNRLFSFLLKQTTSGSDLHLTSTYPHFFINFFFGSKTFIDLKRNWFFLIGKASSPFFIDLTSQKKWYRRSLKLSFFKKFFKLKTMRLQMKLKIKARIKIKEKLKDKIKIKSKTKSKKRIKIKEIYKLTKNDFFFKKLFLNNFFYFLKINPSYSHLKFKFKNLTFLQQKKLHRDSMFNRPLNFTNYWKNYRFRGVFPNSMVIFLFKRYLRIFRFLKKRFVRFRTISFWFLKKKKFINFLRYPSAPVSLLKISKRKVSKRSLLCKDLNFSPTVKTRRNIFIKFPLFLRTYFSRFSRLSRKKKIHRNLLQMMNFFKIKNTRIIKFFFKKTRHRRRFKKFFLISNIISFLAPQSNVKYSIARKIKKNKIYRIKIAVKKKLSFFFLKKNNLLNFIFSKTRFSKKFISLKTQSLKLSKIKKKHPQNDIRVKDILKLRLRPIMYTREKNFFNLRRFGFLYLSDSFLDVNFQNLIIYTLKKIIYSFAYKNELQRYVLKRYTKNTFLNPYTIRQKLFLNTPAPQDSDYFFFNFKDKGSNVLENYNKSMLLPNFASILTNNLQNHPNWSYYDKIIKNRLLDLSEISEFNIRRVRFKPGYMSLWREARKVLQTSMSLKFRYQHRLTRYLTRFNKVVKFKTFLHNEMSLLNILIKSRFLPDQHLYFLFNYGNLIYVNGLNCSNLSFQIITGDLIQLIISAKYYITYRWFMNWSLKKKVRLKKLIRKKNNLKVDLEEKKKSYSLPKWILFSKNSFDDVAKYLEVDYFTLSTFVLYEPFSWIDVNPYSILDTRFAVINLYNWKYIN